MSARPTRALAGWWTDACVPDLGRVLAPVSDKVDVGAFMDWLEPRIAAFRDTMKAHEVVATAAVGLSDVARHAPQLAAALQRLGPHALALLGGADGTSSIRDISARLAIIAARAAQAQIALRRSPGRRAATERNVLLRQVVEWLRAKGVKAILARRIAGDVLRACGVTAPHDDDASRRSARRGQKST